MNQEEEKRNQLKNYARFSGLAIQIGATIYAGSLLGEWLDVKYPNENEIYTKVVTLASVFLAMYSVIKQVTKLTSNDK